MLSSLTWCVLVRPAAGQTARKTTLSVKRRTLSRYRIQTCYYSLLVMRNSEKKLPEKLLFYFSCISVESISNVFICRKPYLNPQ